MMRLGNIRAGDSADSSSLVIVASPSTLLLPGSIHAPSRDHIPVRPTVVAKINIGKNESITLYDITTPHIDGPREHWAITDERVEFTVFATGINGCRQIA